MLAVFGCRKDSTRLKKASSYFPGLDAVESLQGFGLRPKRRPWFPHRWTWGRSQSLGVNTLKPPSLRPILPPRHSPHILHHALLISRGRGHAGWRQRGVTTWSAIKLRQVRGRTGTRRVLWCKTCFSSATPGNVHKLPDFSSVQFTSASFWESQEQKLMLHFEKEAKP